MTNVEKRPLCVDLDGTLVRTDLLVESIFSLLKRNASYIFLLPIWLMRGKAYFKQQIADRVDVDPSLLPYHAAFLKFLKEEHAKGRRLIMATASNEKFAKAIALHLGIFEDVFASDATQNLSGGKKLAQLEDHCGDGGFEYAGNGMVDIPLWQKAGNTILVNPNRGVKEAVEGKGITFLVFDDRTGHLISRYLKALRPHQWLKNLLVFVPLVLDHQLGDPALVRQALVAFLVFGLCASSVYLLNDLLDLSDDRRHPSKRERPFAAGSISITHGAMLIPVLLASAFGLSIYILPVEFTGLLAFYYISTLVYSFALKSAALVDVIVLAGLYTLRIIGGTAAASVPLSFWLLAFSMFLFLSLALIKRYTELMTLQKQGRTGSSARGYGTVDLETLSQFGSASAYLAVLVLALYINSDEVLRLYSRPELIWLLCPMLLYMLTRMWLLARRDLLHEDPVVYVITDRRSQGLAVFGAILLWLAV